MNKIINQHDLDQWERVSDFDLSAALIDDKLSKEDYLDWYGEYVLNGFVLGPVKNESICSKLVCTLTNGYCTLIPASFRPYRSLHADSHLSAVHSYG